MAKPLNGSLGRLADAMRQVFTEAVQVGVKPIKESVDGLKREISMASSGISMASSGISINSWTVWIATLLTSARKLPFIRRGLKLGRARSRVMQRRVVNGMVN